MNRCAPGTKRRKARFAKDEKKLVNRSRSCSVSTVNRGTGLRSQPSNDGGILQTPPRPFLSLYFSSEVYSFSPYGGSVTMASTECSRWASIQVRQSPERRLYCTPSRLPLTAFWFVRLI